jgi:membrane-anchored glycerophosphoryl diester phosphodiesterase (GDPDase)
MIVCIWFQIEVKIVDTLQTFILQENTVAIAVEMPLQKSKNHCGRNIKILEISAIASQL